MRRHRDLLPVGQHELRVSAELLDEAEDVIPAAAVETDDVIPELPEDLVHLEGRENGFDQCRSLDRLRRKAEYLFGVAEHVRPEAGLQVTLGFRKVEVRAASALLESGVVVKQVETEVDESAGHGSTVDLQVLLRQVPAARPDDQRRHRGIQPVNAAIR